MADRTVRAIFEARVSGARKGMTDLSKDVATTGKKVDGLTKDLKTLDATKVSPEIDVKIDAAKKRLSDLTRELADLKGQPSSLAVDFKIEQAKAAIKDVRGEIKELTSQRPEIRVDAAITEAQERIREVTLALGELRTLEVTPQVSADIREAQKRLRDARSELRELNAARAEMRVTADTSPARDAVDDLADDIGDAGARGGADAGLEMVKGILAALAAIPIVGAVVGIGKAVASGIVQGIQDGLQIEAERDIFSAQTGLDEDTSARFGRAAGEAYANAWGDSIAANLDTAKLALRAGIIDSAATDAEIENVIAKLQGLNDLFEYDISESVRGVGNLMKTGMVKDADQAFDLIVAASKKLPSDDLIDTLNEYSNQFVTLGLSADDAFGLIVQGAQAGARDTDIVADAFKEFGLRAGQGTEPAVKALDALGLKSKDIVKGLQKGGPDARAAVDKVFDAIARLERKGIDTSGIVAELFGSPGEDLGSAFYALNVDKVAEALGGVDGAAGAADTALTTMSDNTSTKMETAKRNVELAMDGIKGALAEAFGEEIGGAADWVTKNRAPLMEFFLDVINGAFDMGRSFVEFGASAMEAIADVMDAAAEILVWLPGFSKAEKDAMQDAADGVRESAGTMKAEFTGALDEAQAKANEWAAPEILKAKLHDASVKMAEDMDVFSAAVEEAGGTVTINGETLSAEEALAELTENIDAETGTVSINGDAVPAEDALDVLMALVGASAEDVTVGGDTSEANGDLSRLMSQVRASKGSVVVGAQTSAAEKALRNLERTRYATLQIRVAGVNAQGGQVKGAHDGGFIAKGLHAGGRVPGTDPGYDNVLWPLNSGGRTLQQPLAGGEYVVNSKDAAYWAPVLEMMNSGQRPTSTSETVDQRIDTITVYANTFDEIERKAREKQRIANLGRRRA